MTELFHTIVTRPYVFIFLLAFLGLSFIEQGGKRTLFWLVTGYLVAFIAEWSSINHGVPFGYYVYHDSVLADDLMIAGVPFFDSLSFAFLSYVSFSFAQYLLSPMVKDGATVQRITSRRLRNSSLTLILSAFLMTGLDVVIDPVTHLGKHWFLGDIYHYPDPGDHFGVPLMNYFGWFVVAWVIVFVNQRFDALLASREERNTRFPRQFTLPFQGVYAPLFWFAIVGFQLGVTAWLGWGYDLEFVAHDQQVVWLSEVRKQFLAGLFVTTPMALWSLAHLFNPFTEVRPEVYRAWRSETGQPDE